MSGRRLCVAAALAAMFSSPALGQTIQLGGNATTYPSTSLNNLGQVYTQTATWPAPFAADSLIVSWDGGTDPMPDYTAHLDSGGHVLIIGGSNLAAYAASIQPLFPNDYSQGWHQSSGCANDWTITNAHPSTQYLPATWEFASQTNTYHMMHFDNIQDPNTVLLGQSCEGVPSNIAAIRTYQNNGLLMYMALDVGNYGAEPALSAFLTPLIRGFLESQVPCYDTDGDSVCDGVDACPGFDDNLDADADGDPDGCDTCPNDPDNDIDGDGVCGDLDPCPFDNPDDTDGDTVCDSDDVCAGDDTVDTDGDGFPDDCDNCPDVVQAQQRDDDLDGHGGQCDCDDTNAAINPDAEEHCDGVDEDCDDVIDNDAVDGVLFYLDGDGDGEGTSTSTTTACDGTIPPGYVSNARDCDDNNPAISTAAAELCDGLDNNCNGSVDDGLTCDDADADALADDAFESLGCSCSTTGSAGGWLFPMLILVCGRRRSAR